MHTCLRTTHVQINIQASENTSQRNLQFVASGVIIYQVPCVFATPLNRVLPCNLDPHCGSRTALREVQNNFRGQYGGGENGGGIRDYSNVNIRKDCNYANIHIQITIQTFARKFWQKTKLAPPPHGHSLFLTKVFVTLVPAGGCTSPDIYLFLKIPSPYLRTSIHKCLP